MANEIIPDVQESHTDPIEIVKKYLKLLWRKKIWILIACVVTSIFWILVYSLFIGRLQTYATSAVIRFEDPRTRRPGAVTDFNTMTNVSRVAVIKSNTLITKVVDTLNLNLRIETSNVRHAALFKEIVVGENIEYGIYKLVKNKKKLQVFLTNKGKGINNKLVAENILIPDSTFIFSYQDLKLVLFTSIFARKDEIKLSLIPDRIAGEIIKNRITTRLDLTQTLLTLSYSDTDPEFSAKVTNTIANLFINQLLEFNRYQTSGIIKSLEEQLGVAQAELNNSENELRRFRERNPFVYLATDGQRLVTDLADYESNVSTINQDIQELEGLIERTSASSDFEGEILNYKELLAYLQQRNIPGANPFMLQYEQYESEIRRLINENYSPNHPQIVNTKIRIQDIERQVKNLANQTLETMRGNLKRSQQDIRDFQSNLRRLPRSQLRLAELERNRQIKENIVTSIMSRYNEAKVADAAIIPDAFLIDEAQPPIVSTNIIDLLLKYGVGIILGIVLGMAAIIGIDYFDPSVRSLKELERRVDVPVLASIPVIGNNREIPEDEDLLKRMDSKFITSDYAPQIASESFRLLRTKILLDGKTDQKSVVVASLNPGEGKSLVASNLAITFAQQKLPTILIDCDLRRGVLHTSFNINKKPGISDILISNSPLASEELFNIIQKTQIPRLSLLTSGTQIPNPSELLGSERMKNLYKLLKKEFKVIIFDTPPIEIIPDAFILNNFVNKMLIVTRFGKTNLNKLSVKFNEFSKMKSKIIGLVINASEEVADGKYHSYSYYHY